MVGAGVAVALARLPFAGLVAPAIGIGCFALAAALVLGRVGRFHPHPRFGVANAITLARAGGASVLAALALEPAVAGAAAWATAGAAGGLLALDGLDGHAARRQGLASDFGARFDMEVDAALILVLAALAVGIGKAGPWVLGIGLMRYGFVLAGKVWPAIARPLPPSRRRSAVCGLQVAVLGVILTPAVGPPFSGALAFAALLALALSFAADVLRLAGRR